MTQPTKSLKCPSCGDLMDAGSAYVTISELEGIVAVGGHEPIPEAIQNLPIAGYKYRCSHCECTVDIPATNERPNP